jgi:hypothetical protein
MPLIVALLVLLILLGGGWRLNVNPMILILIIIIALPAFGGWAYWRGPPRQ